MLPVVLTALFLVPATATPTPPAAAPDIDRICAEVTCRPATTVKLRLDGDRVLEVTVPKAPYYYNGVLNILPGEMLYLEGDSVGNQLKNLRIVASPTHKANTITVKFDQLRDPTLDRHMMLTVTSSFSKPLRYQAGILRPQTDHAVGTSTCPVEPNLPSFEHWPEPLVRLLMKDLRLIEPNSDEDKACK
jgi:hypothetical protein